ncbi:MAG: NUDIX domain-containing protein [Mesorhizobium sp.]|nr:MAG: NUDIX domain-containing protein [Mesorhizobium sp.]TIW10848.1 MAG: NUDIX domain-containing protein [Mesorhizobium sp.]
MVSPGGNLPLPVCLTWLASYLCPDGYEERMTFRQDQFFQAVASRRIPRVRVAGIVVDRDSVLVQQPTDDPSACYAFIGGEYELGDTFETRLRKEFEEETNARLIECEYLFCVENHFQHNGNSVQQTEHLFLVNLDRHDVESRESHLDQHWLRIAELATADLRPRVVRDALIDGTYLTRRYLLQTEA